MDRKKIVIGLSSFASILALGAGGTYYYVGNETANKLNTNFNLMVEDLQKNKFKPTNPEIVSTLNTTVGSFDLVNACPNGLISNKISFTVMHDPIKILTDKTLPISLEIVSNHPLLKTPISQKFNGVINEDLSITLDGTFDEFKINPLGSKNSEDLITVSAGSSVLNYAPESSFSSALRIPKISSKLYDLNVKALDITLKTTPSLTSLSLQSKELSTSNLIAQKPSFSFENKINKKQLDNTFSFSTGALKVGNNDLGFKSISVKNILTSDQKSFLPVHNQGLCYLFNPSNIKNATFSKDIDAFLSNDLKLATDISITNAKDESVLNFKSDLSLPANKQTEPNQLNLNTRLALSAQLNSSQDLVKMTINNPEISTSIVNHLLTDNIFKLNIKFNDNKLYINDREQFEDGIFNDVFTNFLDLVNTLYSEKMNQLTPPNPIKK